MDLHNLSQIVRVKVLNFDQTDGYTWFEHMNRYCSMDVKFLGIIIYKKGYHSRLSRGGFSGLINPHTKCEVVIFYSNGKDKTIKFDTLQEAEDYANQLRSQIKTLVPIGIQKLEEHDCD